MQWLLLSLVIMGAFSIVFYTLKNGISPVPSSSKAIEAMFSMVKEVKEGMSIYELGSGWGTIALQACKRFPQTTITGIESSTVPYITSVFLCKIAGRDECTFLKKDIFKSDYSSADIIFTFLHKEAMERLALEIREKVRPDTILISNNFALPGFSPDKVIEIDDLYRSKIYRYNL